MNELAPIAALPLSDVEPDLRWAIRSWLEPGTDGVWRREYLSPEQRSAAAPLLHAWEQQARPVTRDELKAWLLPLAALANSPLDRETFSAKFSLIGAAVDGYPAACFTAQTRAEGLRRWKWFPTPHEVCELLDPVKAAICEPFNALRQAMDAREREARAPDRGMARENVNPDWDERRAANAAFLKQFETTEVVREPVTAKPLPLSDGQLLAVYERLAREENNACAKIRVAMLRKKLGQPA